MTLSPSMSRPTKEGTSTVICVDVASEIRYEEGCTDAAATFSMDSDELSWATLAPTEVVLYSNVCEGKVCDRIPTASVVIAAT